jgi:hypothetical protein
MEPKISLDSITLDDTITLSGYEYSNTTISGGGYTVSNDSNTSISASSYPYTITGAGTSGYPNVTIGAGTGVSYPSWSNSLSPKIRLDGEGADIEVNGWSLIDAIKKIEERLNILHPNAELEAEWEELRELGNRYRELEQHIKDKQATWDRLKAMPPPEID